MANAVTIITEIVDRLSYKPARVFPMSRGAAGRQSGHPAAAPVAAPNAPL
jgi:hypothetical protein